MDLEGEEDMEVDALILIRRLHAQLTQASLAREKCESQLQIQTNLLVNCMDSIEQLQNIREGGSPNAGRRVPIATQSLLIDDEKPTESIEAFQPEAPINSPILAEEEQPSLVALASQGQSGAFRRVPSKKPKKTMAKRGSMIRVSMITAADAMNMVQNKEDENRGKKKWGRVRSIFLKPERDGNSFLAKLKDSAAAQDTSKITSQSKVQNMIDSLEKDESKSDSQDEKKKSKSFFNRGGKSIFSKMFQSNKVTPGGAKGKKRGSLDAMMANSGAAETDDQKDKKSRRASRKSRAEKKKASRGGGKSIWDAFMQGVKGDSAKSVDAAASKDAGAWKLYSDTLNGFDIAIDIVYVCDLVVKCLSPYEDTGHNIITEQSSILGHYLSRNFLFDGLCAVPLDLCLLAGASFSATPIVVDFRVIRISKLLYFLRYMDLSVYNVSLRDIPKIDPVVLRLVKMIFFLALFLHWVSCVAIHVADIDRDEVAPLIGGGSGYAIDLWLGVADFEDENDRLKYCLCLYFTFVTMIGEKTSPQTERQVVTTLVMLICGLVTYVSIVGNLVSLINQIDSSSSAYNQKRDQLAMYMNSRNFPPKLRHRINRYFHYLHEKNKGIDDATMIEDLPPYLRKEVALFLSRNIIVKVPMFRGLSITFITALVIRLKPLLCLEDDYIIRDGEVGNEMYFLLKGHVQVIDPEGGIIASLPAGSFFGEMALVYNEKRNASVRASNTCELLVLTRKAFEEVVVQFPDEATVITQYARERYKETMNTQQQQKAPRQVKTAVEIKQERMRRSSIDAMIWGSEEQAEGFESILALQSASRQSETTVSSLEPPEEPEDPISIGEA